MKEEFEKLKKELAGLLDKYSHLGKEKFHEIWDALTHDNTKK